MRNLKPLCLLMCALTIGANVFAVSYSYDSLNRLTNVDYGNGSVISYTYDAAGNRLTYSGAVANDTILPSIAITIPTTGSSYTNTSATINLSGTASDNVGVTLVTWQNLSGGVGVASGTNSWSINGIPLQSGQNAIFVTAYDAAGNIGTATLVVTYVVPPVIQIAGLTIASNATVQLTVVGPAGGVLAVQTSTNLVQWYTIGVVTNAAGSFQFVFPFSRLESKRFFRAALANGQSVGTVIAWGDNTYGQCNVPQGLTNVMAIAAGYQHSLALKMDGTVAAWGKDDDNGEADVPVGLSNVKAIAAGWGTSLALKGDGTVKAWGWDGGYR